MEESEKTEQDSALKPGALAADQDGIGPAPGTKPDHMCILVHGLWGNPAHLQAVSTSLAEKHPSVHILVAKRNSNSFTYDGIEVGGERVAQEIEDELAELEKTGHTITKMSIVGYSLGGLIARYCIGLLFKRGIFDKIKPINFTAFASPFLGVRTPFRGYHSSLWNVLGGHTLSTSGYQLFLIDKFRDTGRPLLSVLADPDSIFIEGLRLFKNRVLYANIINDRSAPWYTTGVSRSDPFEDLDAVRLNYLKGYGPVILDPDNPVRLKEKEQLALATRAWNASGSFVNSIPLYAMMTVLAPIGTAVFLVNSGIQTVRSSQRVKMHNEGFAGSFLPYRIPVMMEHAIESLSSDRPHLQDTSSDSEAEQIAKRPGQLYRTRSRPEFPVLALTKEQFEMIETLNDVGFKKYPVHISLVRHSHAAIIVRSTREGFKEGHTVIKHWLNEEFEL